MFASPETWGIGGHFIGGFGNRLLLVSGRWAVVEEAVEGYVVGNFIFLASG